MTVFPPFHHLGLRFQTLHIGSWLEYIQCYCVLLSYYLQFIARISNSAHSFRFILLQWFRETFAVKLFSICISVWLIYGDVIHYVENYHNLIKNTAHWVFKCFMHNLQIYIMKIKMFSVKITKVMSCIDMLMNWSPSIKVMACCLIHLNKLSFQVTLHEIWL